MEDQEITQLYFARDEEAIRKTEEKYGRLCYKIAYNILEDTGDAEECLQDTLAGAWNAIPPARPQSLGAFLSRIARNLALKRLKSKTSQKRRGQTVSLEELEEVLGDGEYQGEESELGRHISEFLRREKKEARRVFLRKYYFFDSVSEISRRYSFSESKVKNMLYHTRQRLRAYLIKKGII